MRKAVALGIALMALAACQREPARMRNLPARMLWAWESPQDLRFLEKGEGVAFLGGELHFSEGKSRWIPRRNPLYVNPETPLLAVLRVEAGRETLNESQTEVLVTRALELLALPRVRGLQVDFDALESQRPFYVQALKRLRSRMNTDTPLSITALASWCLEDHWLAVLHGVVDEAVPMLFRMGPDNPNVRQRLERGDVIEPLARFSYGLSTDEPRPHLRGHRRCYVFHPGSWNREAWQRIALELP